MRRVTPAELDREARGGAHQGVVADVRASGALSVEDLVVGAAGAPLIVVLDGIEDPHNVGAILRTVDAAGADGRRAAVAARGAAGRRGGEGVGRRRLAREDRGGREHRARARGAEGRRRLDGRARRRRSERATTRSIYTLPTALVVGGEGAGLRRLVRERCDWLVSIPMRGHVQSLNVSVADRHRAVRGGPAAAERQGAATEIG